MLVIELTAGGVTKMRFKGFIGGSYKLNSLNADCQRCLNLFYVINEAGTEKEGETGYLLGTPGFELLFTLPTSPIRGIYTATNNGLFVVSGNKFYVIDTTDYSYIELGTLTTSTGIVTFTDNGTLLVIADDNGAYTYTLLGAVFAQITDPDFRGSKFVSFLDGYFIFPIANTGQFQYSGIYNADFDPLDFQTAEGNPDYILAQITNQREVWFFGTRSLEVFYATGTNGDNAFQRNQSGFIEYGIIAPYSVVKLANTVFWLGRDENGSGQVYLANGYLPQRISTFSIERAIQSYTTINDAQAFGYQQGGHNFYVINFPTANATWVFDQTTQLWHERGSMDSNGAINIYRANSHGLHNNINYMGDRNNGNVYRVALDVYVENGGLIPRIRTSPHISQGLKNIFYKSLQLDIESGVGLPVTENEAGYDPVAIMTFSDDGGHTWSNESAKSMGKLGEYKRRLIWRKLGRARDRVYSIKIVEPVKIAILGAEFEATQGVS